MQEPGVEESARLTYSVHESASVLGVSISTIERAIREGTLPSFTFGRRRLIPADGLADWVRKQAEGGEA